MPPDPRGSGGRTHRTLRQQSADRFAFVKTEGRKGARGASKEERASVVLPDPGAPSAQLYLADADSADQPTRAGRRGADGAIARLTRRSRVWTLLRTPAADISVVHDGFARVWSFFVPVPMSARGILWRGRPRYAAAESQGTVLLPIRCRARRGVRAGSCFQPVVGCGTHCENPMAGDIDLSE